MDCALWNDWLQRGIETYEFRIWVPRYFDSDGLHHLAALVRKSRQKQSRSFFARPSVTEMRFSECYFQAVTVDNLDKLKGWPTSTLRKIAP
jgi:hypothetical protein